MMTHFLALVWDVVQDIVLVTGAISVLIIAVCLWKVVRAWCELNKEIKREQPQQPVAVLSSIARAQINQILAREEQREGY
jgi:large-conductance mechanosensitive channel